MAECSRRRVFALLATVIVISAGNPPGFAGPAAAPCRWAGIYPTVVTPFCANGTIDVPALERQLHHELHGGVHGLLVLGTLGEGQYVQSEERTQVIATAVRVAHGQVPVLVGIHTCDIEVAQAQLCQARDLGASAVLIKYLGNPHASAAAVHGFYSALASLRILPIFYYHFPSQTDLKLSAADVARIALLHGIVGIKESTLDLREVQAHIHLLKGQGKVVLSSSALDLVQFMDLGGHGAMCPEAVLLPGPTVQAYSAYVRCRHEEARAIQTELFDVLPILRAGAMPPTISRVVFMSAEDHMVPLPMGDDQPQARLKAALCCLGVPTPIWVKCPLPALTRHDQDCVKVTVARLKDIDWCEVAMQAPPVPLHTCPCEEEGGLLLKTGSFLLGPQVNNDILRMNGDHLGGL